MKETREFGQRNFESCVVDTHFVKQLVSLSYKSHKSKFLSIWFNVIRVSVQEIREGVDQCGKLWPLPGAG